MNALNLLYVSLVLHISGLAIVTGSTVSEYVLFKQFWKIYNESNEKSDVAYQLLLRVSQLFGVGMGLTILSGISMFLVTGGEFASQKWFQVKIILVLILLINGLVVGRRVRINGRHVLKYGAAGNTGGEFLKNVKRRIKIFHFVQMLIILVIFICSIFKFN